MRVGYRKYNTTLSETSRICTKLRPVGSRSRGAVSAGPDWGWPGGGPGKARWPHRDWGWGGGPGGRGGGGRDALEGNGPRRRHQRRLGRRLEEVAKAVRGGYCRL